MGSNSQEVRRINRVTSLQTILVVFIANIILALIYYKTLYVRQSTIDTSKLDSMQLGTSGTRLCLDQAQDSFLALKFSH
jgi:hypothetical protein